MFITVKQAAEKWDISERRIQVLCREGRIEGVKRFGRAWAIPEDAEKTSIYSDKFSDIFNRKREYLEFIDTITLNKKQVFLLLFLQF